MSEVDPGTGAADEAPAVESAEINYEQPNLARTGEQATEDGTAPGEKAADEPADDGKTAEERASEAGTELAGRKRTLAADLKTERERRQTAETALAEERRLIDSWRPILDKLDGRPDLQQAVLNGSMTVAKAEAEKDRGDQQELQEIAEDLGYYKLKTDGTPDYAQPDLARAERYRARHLKWADQRADAKVQPVAQDSTERKIVTRIEQAVAYATKEGDADPEIVREMFTAHAKKDPRWVLDNESGNTLYDKAIARTHREKKAGTLRTAPTARTERREDARDFVTTEAAGGGKSAGPKLTASEKALGEQYGLTDKDWALAESHAGVRRGYTRLTED